MGARRHASTAALETVQVKGFKGGQQRRRRTSPAKLREQRAAVDDVGVLLDSAARFLEARSRSVAEVRRRLVTSGYRPQLVEEAVSRLIQQGYLDDDAFARAWVESRDRARPRGERALRLELIQKGIVRETIDAVLGERAAGRTAQGRGGAAGISSVSHAESDDDEVGRSADDIAARRLIERNRRALLRETDPRKRRQRAYALLARSGFDPETCRTVAASVADLDEGEESEIPATEGP